jgi:hypothetical protein
MPIVLGNKVSSNAAVKPVAFIGQVPIKVKGIVQSGDYILPSGENDGIGIAVSKKNIKIEQLHLIIGQSWSSVTKNSGISDVNVALTVGSYDMVEALKFKQDALEAENKELKSILNQLLHDVETLKKK